MTKILQLNADPDTETDAPSQFGSTVSLAACA
jgi:hypothetical protein